MPKHRAQLLLTSETATRDELAEMLRHAAEWLADRYEEDYPGDTVRACVVDDMEDED